MLRAINITCKHFLFYCIMLVACDAVDKSDEVWRQAQDDYNSSVAYQKPSVSSPVASQEQLTCLATAVYHEARNQPIEGQEAVARVILNRAKVYKKSICKVVKEKRNGVYQFSFMALENKKVKDKASWKKANIVANEALEGNVREHKAMYFKVCSVDSEFFNKLKLMFREGDHCFYKRGRV